MYLPVYQWVKQKTPTFYSWCPLGYSLFNYYLFLSDWERTLAANDFWIWELPLDLIISEACEAIFFHLFFYSCWSLFLKRKDVIVKHPWLKSYKLIRFGIFFLWFFTRKAKCFLAKLTSIQTLPIFQCDIRRKNQFTLITFFQAICLLSKRFFPDESGKVWKSAETNTKINIDSGFSRRSFVSAISVWVHLRLDPQMNSFLESEVCGKLYHWVCLIQIK